MIAMIHGNFSAFFSFFNFRKFCYFLCSLADQQREMILLQAKLEESVRDCEKAEMQLADYQRNVQRQVLLTLILMFRVFN